MRAWLCIMVASVAAAQPPRTVPDPVKIFRTSGRRMVLAGTNSLEMLDAGAWAERMADSLQQRLGIPLPCDDREIRIAVLRRPADPAPPPCSPPGVGDAFEEGRRVQRLVVAAPACLEEPRAVAAWCRLLLAGAVDAAHPPRRGGARGLARVPPWLAAGLAAGLDAHGRSTAVLDTLERWEAGSVPPLTAWLGTAATNTAALGPAERSLYGAFVAWLLDAPKRAGRSRLLLKTLAETGGVSVGWLAALPGIGGEPDAAWDAWLLEQRRVVFVAGNATIRATRRLRAGLLLYPGDSGIPLGAGITPGSGLGALARFSGADWMEGFCRGRKAELNMLSAGRGAAFRAVVARYGEYLDAVARGIGVARLRELLHEANKGLAALEAGQTDVKP